jgi:hypothetical protein
VLRGIGGQVAGAEREAVHDVGTLPAAPNPLELLAAGDGSVGELLPHWGGRRLPIGNVDPGHLEGAAELRRCDVGDIRQDAAIV